MINFDVQTEENGNISKTTIIPPEADPREFRFRRCQDPVLRPELEQAVLGALMLEKDAYSGDQRDLETGMLLRKAHEKIFAPFKTRRSIRNPSTCWPSSNISRNAGELEEVGGPSISPSWRRRWPAAKSCPNIMPASSLQKFSPANSSALQPRSRIRLSTKPSTWTIWCRKLKANRVRRSHNAT